MRIFAHSKHNADETMGFEYIEVLFRGLCVGVAASITVGPVAVLCIQPVSYTHLRAHETSV